ncbi:MAG: amino acid adenylation domain-containing protein [Lachnospiraceae bacterium]|nr:amino acid adenylation domain-containing protein [Lachnospiraceae bacterium]
MSKEYLLSKEEKSLYLACALSPDRKNAYLVGWSVTLPAETDKKRIEDAVERLFDKHRIFTARIKSDKEGSLYKYDCGEKPVIEYESCDTDDPSAEDYYQDMDLDGGRLYRIVVVSTPSSIVLYMIFHHIILDGTGRQTMVRDFEAAFRGEDIGEPDLKPYEFSEKEYENEKKPEFAEDREYYKELLSGIEYEPPEPDLNEDEESFHQKYYPFENINGADVKNKKEQSGVRTSSIFLGAVGYALALFSGSEQSVVASAMSGRTDEIKGSCGMFVRTLPMVCNIDPSRAVDDYLKELDEETTQCREHSLFTYMDMSHELKLSLPISFAYQGDMIADRREFDGMERKMEFLRADPSDYEMRLYLWRKDGKYLFEALYRSDHYSESYMDSLADTVEQVLSELLTKEKMSDVDPLSSTQRDLLDSFNRTEADYEKKDVVSQFRFRAAEYPDNAALSFKEKTLSYRETDELTDRIAAFISGSGIGRENVVSVLIPRNEYMVLASLGILKAGAAYEPLDPSYPPERLEFMIADSGSKLLIADRNLMDRVPSYKGKTLFLDEIDKLPAAKALETHPSPEDRFIMLYTSGTTGTPKGVMLEHRNLAAFCAWYRKYYSLKESSKVAAYASYGFDANMMDMYPALTSGACVVIIPEEDRLDLFAIKERFDKEGVTHSFMTTQVGRQFAEFYEQGSLKYLSAGGEKLAPIYIDKGFGFYNVYGPTECTIISSVFKIDKLYKRIPIGRPLDNMKFYVCDKLLRRLPSGAPGELLISGHQVGRGYHNLPEKDKEVFISNSFTGEEGYERCYRTGDVVRILPDGNTDFVGRKDGQVKIRGFRIEMGEVEAVIRDYPGIKDVTVQAFDAESGGKFIAAYIVSDEKIDIEAMNSFVGSRKPSYMIPAVTMQIDRIPLNQNQKVNKRELPAPVFQAKENEEEKTALNRLEEEIITLIKDTAGISGLGLSGKLTDYGVDSINSIRLVPAINEAFKTDIPVTKLLDGMSVLDIENAVLDSWRFLVMDDGASSDKAGSPKEKRTSSRLSSVQMAVYYDAVQKEEECLYNIPSCYKFSDTDEKSLKNAVEAAISAHPCLAAHLKMEKGELFQVFNENTSPEVALYEMTEEELVSFREGFVRPFDLMKGPLYHAEVVKTETALYLFLDVHHLIYDGFSSSILMDDVLSALSGNTPESEGYTAMDYSFDEEEAVHSPEYERAEEYYKEQFKKYEEPTMIPADLSGKEAEGLMAIVSVKEDKAAVDRFCKERGITPAALFLSSTLLTASRYSGNKKAAISMLSSGRSDSRTLRSVGMFVHTVPLVFDLDRDLSASDFAVEAGTVMKDSIKNEIFPFSSIAAEYGYRTEIMYEYQVGVTGDEKKVKRIPLALETPKFKTAVVIGEEDGQYLISLRYNDELYSADHMEAFLKAFSHVTQSMIADPKADIRHISLMGSEEEKKVLGFGEAPGNPPAHELLHKAFEGAAAKYPERDALITSEGRKTFAELNHAAGIIAGNLRKYNIGPENGVLLLLPRKWYYFATMFGVLKTGAFFIPCDPEYPSDRISHILEDSGAGHIITTGDHKDVCREGSVLIIDELLTGEETEVSENVKPGDLAYMIYTSGSTGRPKGVELTHLGICNYVNADKKSPFFYYIAEGPKKVVSVTTVSFDMSFKDTVGVLINGGTVIFTNEEEMNDPRALSLMIEKNGADVFSATPSRILQYMEYEPFFTALSKCSLVICGGEAYPLTLLKKLKTIKDIRILNSYGPTEITVSSNMAELTHADHISIGPPLPGYTEFIVDSDDNLLPAGVAGELLIGGPGVARGYHNLSEQTEKSFVMYRGQRVYRSGDYARWDKDGNVVILGRKDNQLKLRGLRIEPDEIRSLMEEQEGIRKAVVTIKKISGLENLCAYFTADKKIDIAALKEALSRKLTKYMVPTAYLQLEEIPVSPNGKTDLKALPEPEMLVSSEYVPPVTDAEICFAEIFKDVLKLDRVGATDDFFDIGGTSLVAASVVIEAERKGYPIAFGNLFKYKTPRALAAFLKGKEPGNTDPSTGNDFSGYDMDAVNKALAGNTMEAFLADGSRDIGNILLTGATGFMGIHLLFEFLKQEKGNVYCLVRPTKKEGARQRLENLLFFYFGDVLGERVRSVYSTIKHRIVVVEGDVTDEGSFEQLKSYDIDTVFNCAANVKHFSKGTDIEDVNVRGVDNCIKFCLDKGARLIHFSTISVAGSIRDIPENAGKILDEQSMFFDQTLENQYSASKMKAELNVMQAVAQKGLSAKIIRVGSLSARERDGEFQANYLSNSFAGRLRSYFVLKAFPYSMMDSSVRMGPIDISCRAFLELAKTGDRNTLFHAVNNDTLPLSVLINAMKRCGVEIDYVEDKEFDRRFKEAELDPSKAKILQSISAYRSLHNRNGMREVSVDSEFTTQVLAREGFFWPVLGMGYLDNFINGLIGLGFFDEDYLNR